MSNLTVLPIRTDPAGQLADPATARDTEVRALIVREAERDGLTVLTHPATETSYCSRLLTLCG